MPDTAHDRQQDAQERLRDSIYRQDRPAARPERTLPPGPSVRVSITIDGTGRHDKRYDMASMVFPGSPPEYLWATVQATVNATLQALLDDVSPGHRTAVTKSPMRPPMHWV